MRLIAGFFAALLFSNHTIATVQKDLNGNEGIRILDQQYSLRVVQLLNQSALRDNKNFTLQQTADLIVDNQLIANEAVHEFGKDALIQSENRVGFPDQYLLQMQYTSTVEYLFKDAIETQSPKINVKKFITQPFTCESPTLVRLLALGQRQEFQLSNSELLAADKFKLMVFQFPNTKPESISLGDIYRQQNVQGRIALHNGDCTMLQSATEHQLGERYIDYWMTTYSGLSGAEIQQLKMALSTRYIKDRYLEKLGIAQDAHDDSDYVIAKTKTITQEEISVYYNKHRDQFKRVTKARGRHLLVNDQALADKIYSELVNGLDFDRAINQYSQAADKTSKTPGAVDWVYNNNKMMAWRDTLFLILPLKQINRPFKAPLTSEWEIVMVDKRVEEYQAADSEGVRYQVSQILARQAIAEEFRNTRKRLYADTLIHVNSVLARKEQL